MKYIRTKDGIYEVLWQDSVDVFSVKDKNMYVKGVRQIHKLAIIEQADTIEELCDCYVVYEKAGGFAEERHIYNDLELAKYAANEYVSIVYGAIWTDKGLIYVAKMNEKGEFELL